ncbi:MAG: hypothetical protein R3F04_07090 [Lysobacteraceae bacterium]
MRTKDPIGIRNDFLASLIDAKTTFTNSEVSKATAKQKNLIAEYTFLAAATLWEGYLSDVFVAYINRDRSAFCAQMVSKMQVKTEDAYAKRASTHASINMSNHLTVAEIRAILDANDYNVTFKSVDDLKEKAALWLAPAHRRNFLSLNAQQSAGLGTVRSIRNFLAHRSGASKVTMQADLVDPNLDVPLRRGTNQIKDVGSFLRSKPVVNQDSRQLRYFAFLEQRAHQLCP